MTEIGDVIRLGLEIRALEQTILNLHERGCLEGTVHCCLGQETIPATIGTLVTGTRDFVYGTHRGHGFWYAFNRNA